LPVPARQNVVLQVGTRAYGAGDLLSHILGPTRHRDHGRIDLAELTRAQVHGTPADVHARGSPQ
jgi:hypothetical protein